MAATQESKTTAAEAAVDYAALKRSGSAWPGRVGTTRGSAS
jgi:hypothetical protein